MPYTPIPFSSTSGQCCRPGRVPTSPAWIEASRPLRYDPRTGGLTIDIDKSVSDSGNPVENRAVRDEISRLDGKIETAVSSVYKVMGSCKPSELPASARRGDVWDMTETGTAPGGVEVFKGDNVVWAGDRWDRLSSSSGGSGAGIAPEIAVEAVDGLESARNVSDIKSALVTFFDNYTSATPRP